MMKPSKNPKVAGSKKTWRAFELQWIGRCMLPRLAVATLLIAAGTACKHNKNATTTVTRRAAFDFSCPKEDLMLNVVDTEGVRKKAAQIAVRGCGQKAVYVYYPDFDTWVIDGTVRTLSADYEVPPPIDKGMGKRGDKQTIKAEKRGKMTNEPSEPTKKEKRRARKDGDAPTADETPAVEAAPEN